MTICMNVPHASALAKIVEEFVAYRCPEFKAYLDGQRGGWTIEFESDMGLNWWRTVVGGYGGGLGAEAWER